MNILQKIQKTKSTLSKSEVKVADVVLADPQVTIRSSIATLARTADVSEPTVNRFCRSLDCKGFPDFKLKVAQCLASGTPYVNSTVEPFDSVKEFGVKIFDMTMSALEDAKSNLDFENLARAIDLLSSARKIEFHGLGASSSVALDAQNKFFRLNTPVVAYTDVVMQRMAAVAASRGEVIVIISYTGRSIASIETAQLAREAGATVISITNPQSPLARASSLVIAVETSEDTDIYTPAVSRLLHLVILDILATGVSLKRGPDFAQHLKKMKDALKATRIEKTEVPLH
ncbi:MAG: transcriptional regulator HexR [Bdellovibrionota bacterium]|nr:MAG: transcriptional regulator HexR [Pseudomonadota bacterium]